MSVVGITKHQYYHKPSNTRSGRRPSSETKKQDGISIKVVSNKEVVSRIKEVQSDPDTNYGYRKMTYQLQQDGYHINHKKVYRLMRERYMLKEKPKKQTKSYAQYRIVTPTAPLRVIEMDIKYVWTTRSRQHAYILTVIDTFTRHVLHWQVGHSMKTTQVKQAWDHIIEQYLQPANLYNSKIDIEIRNDNGPQFGSKKIRDYFELNKLSQVFTHPYTPQENGHVESFHAILSKALEVQVFWDINELEERLIMFYEKYNNVRLHSSIANLTPRMFWNLWDKGLIEKQVMKNRKNKFKLKIPYQQISGIENLREVPCLNSNGLEAPLDLHKKVSELESLQQPSVQRSPSVVPC